MRLSIIIVSWNTCELLRRCLAAIKHTVNNIDYEVFVIDNNSSDSSAKMVASTYPAATLFANKENRGFAAANNQAIVAAAGEYILLLNPDTEVKDQAIAKLIKFLDEHPQAGVVAPQLINSDNTIQRSCRQFPTFLGMLYELLGLSKLFPYQAKFRQYKMLDWNHDDTRQVDQPEGACLLVRRKVIDQAGMLDEGFFMLFEEVDWCYRIKQKGWQIWFTPDAQVVHHYGQSIKQVKIKMILSSHRGLYRFWLKHYQKGRWYLSPVAYIGLMVLAYARIVAYCLKQLLSSISSTCWQKSHQER